MKKVILKVFVRDERAKRKGIKVVSGLPGVESISMDMKDQKLTVIGDIDPVDLVNKLRKFCSAEIVSVGPAKEEKKKEEPKKKDKKEKEPLKEEPKKEKEPEKEEPKKDEKKEAEMAELIKAYQIYNPYMTQQHDFVRSAEENPNACAIC